MEPSSVYGLLVKGQLFGSGAELVVIVRSVVVSAIVPVVVPGPVVVSSTGAVVVSFIEVVVILSMVAVVVSSASVVVVSSVELGMLLETVVTVVVASAVDEPTSGKGFGIVVDVSRAVSLVFREVLELVNPVGVDEGCEFKLVDAEEAGLIASFDVLVGSTISEEAEVDTSVFPVAVDSLLLTLPELIVSMTLVEDTVLEIVEVLTPTR